MIIKLFTKTEQNLKLFSNHLWYVSIQMQVLFSSYKGFFFSKQYKNKLDAAWSASGGLAKMTRWPTGTTVQGEVSSHTEDGGAPEATLLRQVEAVKEAAAAAGTTLNGSPKGSPIRREAATAASNMEIRASIKYHNVMYR
jgi:hypothetical protein